MENNQLDFQVGVAGLGLGAFSGLLDAISTCSKVYGLWRSLRNLKGFLAVLRTKLILQEALLDQWQREWLTFPVSGHLAVQKFQLLKVHEDVVLASLETVRSLLETLEPLRMASGTSEGALERLKLATGGASDCDRTLTQISTILNDLHRLMPLANPNLGISQTIMSLEYVNEEEYSISGAEKDMIDAAHGQKTFKKALSFRRLAEDLERELEERVSSFKHTLPTATLTINPGRVKIAQDDETSAGYRSFGVLDSKTPVLVEWKKYDASWKGEKGIRLRGRIHNIAQLLHADTKPNELLTLKCLGFYDDYERSRYALLFAYPSATEPNPKMRSLKSLLERPTQETLPTLGERYQVAYSISLSVAILHAAGWLQKSIRSQNIMFPIINGRPSWSRPYLVGFDFSRPDAADESSERPEQSVRFNLYRHPSAQGIPGESYRKAFDIYSLGVVLLEIGLWKQAWSLWRDGTSAVEFRSVVISKSSDWLSHFMGIEYQDATVKCLTGRLEGHDSIVRAFYLEVVERIRTIVEPF